MRAKLLAAVAVAALCIGSPSVSLAETPADTFIQAWTLDDIISLDPAEVFESSASEILGNTCEPIMSYDLDDASKIFGVDLLMANEVDGGYGYYWLKTNYAGSGAYTIREWRANESVGLERNDNYGGPRPTMARAIHRHIPEAATRRLLLEKGGIDMARDLLPEEIAALSTSPDVTIETGVKGTIFQMALNQKNEFLSRPEVRGAMKYLVDCQAIADTIGKGKMDVYQTFLPKGFLGGLDRNPHALNVAKARELLAAADLPDGFTVTMDTRNTPDVTAIAQAVQQTMAEAGIMIEIIPGDGGQTPEKYRARTHDIYIGNWGPDHQDPHTNATFARNPRSPNGAR